MNVLIGKAFNGNREAAERTRRISQALEETGPTSKRVTADWDLVTDADRRRWVTLTLSDDTGIRVETRFMPDEFANDSRLLARLYRVWGDLLQERSHKQLDALLAGSSEK